ncbi:phosphonate ABC transporter, permease protein PhnE [Streptomyces sp. NPDC054796]
MKKADTPPEHPAAPALPPPPRVSAARWALRLTGAVAAAALLWQALVRTETRPGELLAGLHGIADIVRRSFPPDFDSVGAILPAALESFDTALLGTAAAVVLALPLACCAAENISPHPLFYYAARAVITVCRAVPDIIWALVFVTAVGLGPFPGVLAITVHSVGMLGRLIAEVIEDADPLPVEALRITGAGGLQIVTHAVLPGILPSVLGIVLYRLDENVRASLTLGFVGAGGIGFEILTAVNLFQYRRLAVLLLTVFVMILTVERLSARLRRRVA